MRSEKPLYKRVWFWLVSALALYTFIGFIALPLALTHIAPQKLKETIGIDFRVEKVCFNPFNFKITLFHPLVKDKHNKEVISFESLHVDLNPSALINKEVLVKTLELKKPKIFVHLQKDGTLNLNTLIPQTSPKEESSQEESPLDLIFSVKDLDIIEAEILLQDDTQETPFKLELKPLNYSARDISTKSGKLAAHKFEATSTYAKKIAWEGGLSLEPLKLYGKITVEDAKLEALNNYSNLSISRGFASLYLPYKVNIDDNGISLHVEDAKLTLNDLLMMEKNAKLAHVGQFKLSDIEIDTKINEGTTDINLPKTTLSSSNIILFEKNKQGAYLDTFEIPKISSNISLKKGETSGEVELLGIKADKAKAFTLSNTALNAKLESLLIDSIKTKISSLSDIEVDVSNIKINKAKASNPAKVAINAKFESILIDSVKTNIKEGIKVAIPSVYVNNFRVKHLDNSPLLGFDKFGVENIALDLEKQNINVEKTSLFGLYANAILKKDGSLDVASLTPKEKKSTKVTKKEEPTKPWNYAINSVEIKNAKASLSDLTVKKPITHKLSSISLHVNNFDSKFNTPFDYKLSLKDKKIFGLSSSGKVTIEPLHVKSNLDIKHTNLEKYQPYLEPFTMLYLKSAKLFTDAKIDLKMPKGKPLRVSSNANTKIQNLLLTNNDKPLFSWKELDVKGIAYNHTPMSLSIKSINIDKPYAKVKINEDRSTNLDNIIKETKSEKAPTKQTSKSAKKPNIKIGPMTLKKGSADFADFSLPLKFATKIHDLEGSVSKLNLNSTQPSKMSLKGLVDKYGYANIEGTLSPFAIKNHADIGVTFKNIDLTNMTPYSGKFVGYAIKEGKLSLDLNYNIRDAALQGDNKINLDSLTLGEKIESKDAMNLPLDLAIALLKDSNGQIDIDLPVAGDLNNPKFSYGAVVVKAITNLITGIITAPFKMLGSLLGIDGEKLKSIDFEPAFATLLPSEMQKMQSYSKMLGKRPGIKLKVFGSFDEEVDGKALREIQITNEIEAKMKTLDANTSEEQRYQRALEETYLANFTQEDLNTTLQKYTEIEKVDENTTKEPKTPIIDYAKLNDDLREQLYKSVKITKEQFANLAKSRASTISTELQKVSIDKSRILIEPTETTKAKQNKWIACKVKIGN